MIDVTSSLSDYLEGNHGIIISEWEDTDISGHADIFDGVSCPHSENCNIGDTVHFWKLN